LEAGLVGRRELILPGLLGGCGVSLWLALLQLLGVGRALYLLAVAPALARAMADGR
jgi:hypothetical protein